MRSKKGYFPNLIDVGKLYEMLILEQPETISEVKKIILKQKIVKAIPLDWLEKEAEKNTYSDDTLTYAIDLWKGNIENDAP